LWKWLCFFRKGTCSHVLTREIVVFPKRCMCSPREWSCFSRKCLCFTKRMVVFSREMLMFSKEMIVFHREMFVVLMDQNSCASKGGMVRFLEKCLCSLRNSFPKNKMYWFLKKMVHVFMREHGCFPWGNGCIALGMVFFQVLIRNEGFSNKKKRWLLYFPWKT